MRQVEIKCKHISRSGWRARDRWGLINFLYVGLSFRTFNVWQSWYMKSSQHIFWNVDLLCAKSFILKEVPLPHSPNIIPSSAAFWAAMLLTCVENSETCKESLICSHQTECQNHLVSSGWKAMEHFLQGFRWLSGLWLLPEKFPTISVCKEFAVGIMCKKMSCCLLAMHTAIVCSVSLWQCPQLKHNKMLDVWWSYPFCNNAVIDLN